MAVIKCKKYQISLDYNSNKVQGLEVGDIVRRQYFDGKNVIYSLMLVTKTGVNTILVDEEEKEQKFFQGYLLSGDPILSGEIMDFARITNLFDEERLGLLYFTASDSFAPYMDLIDGIGKNASLCWPESMSLSGNFDSSKQYVTYGNISGEYIKEYEHNKRVCHLTFQSNNQKAGIVQDFYQYVENPNRIIISYKIKASKEVSGMVTLGYQDGTRIDGTDPVSISTEWQYKSHVIGVDWSGRHLRSVTLELGLECNVGDEVWISDFNIIMQSSVEDFSIGSKARIGKLDGIVDPVFGQLKGYGSYLHKLYATQGAHISGTLTAGDENGFGGTFYAGKIVRNMFVNSTSIQWLSNVPSTEEIVNPVGIGQVYQLPISSTCFAQTTSWASSRIGDTYTLSMWVYFRNTCTHTILLEGEVIGVLEIEPEDLFVWKRYAVTFKIPDKPFTSGLCFTYETVFDAISTDTGDETANMFFYVAPQLESGENATQYQATDNVIADTDEYGAWFCRGGIGGTMQNPLLKLNFDGDGSIGSRNNSFVIRQDGSGHLANENIRWTSEGNVVFGPGVQLTWNNFDDDFKDQVKVKSISIVGANQFEVSQNFITNELSYTPSFINLSLSTIGFNLSNATNIQWLYLDKNGGYTQISGSESSNMLQIFPTGEYWVNNLSCTIKCIVTSNQTDYVDTILIQKKIVQGYEVKIRSSAGQFFYNGVCKTILTAELSYNGIIIPSNEAAEEFDFIWKRFVNGVEDPSWISPNTSNIITVDNVINDTALYMCEVIKKTVTSCFGSGHWINELPWINTEPWKNN